VPIWPNANLLSDSSFTVSLYGLSGSGVTLTRSTGVGMIFGGGRHRAELIDDPIGEPGPSPLGSRLKTHRDESNVTYRAGS
jgi:hypothetical protein